MRYVIPILIFSIFCGISENAYSQTFEAGSTTQLDSLKVLSWNIYMLPPLVKITGKRKRAVAIGEKLKNSDYDVLVLQEAFHAGARRRIYKRLKDTYSYKIGPAFKRYFSMKTSSGVWVLSKYPLKAIGKTKFNKKSGFDNKMARKGAMMVEVDKNGQKFEIIGTHLNAGGSLELRSNQMRQIKTDLVDKYHQKDVPLIISGDFNTEKFDDCGLDSMTTILQVEDYQLDGDNKYTYDDKNDLRKSKSKGVIDYVYFVPGKLKVKRTSRIIPLIEKIWSGRKKSLSDHNPVELLLYYQP